MLILGHIPPCIIIIDLNIIFVGNCPWSYQSGFFLDKDVLHLIKASVYSISSFSLYQRLLNL